MTKRIFIIHGWGNTPESDWYPWLKTELKRRGFAVQIPAMPDTNQPEIDAWVSHLSDVVGTPDEETSVVGHSIGCQAILRYLERLPKQMRISGAVFVAGWFTLSGLDEEEEAIARPWLKTPLDCQKIRQHVANITAIFSDDDPYVPPENQRLFEERLGAAMRVEKGKGHFAVEDGVSVLPVALDAVLAMAGP